MTKKDYIKIAAVLADFKGRLDIGDYTDPTKDNGIRVFDDLTDDFCSLFVEDNPRFDLNKFKSAVNG